MTDLRKAAEMALDFMDWLCGDDNSDRPKYTALNLESFLLLARTELRQALAQPKREWVGLTDDEIKEIIGPWGETPIKGYTRKLFDQIEAKLKEKNT
jgi:hypothetical protein